jgi:hypothetical protein
MDIFLSGASKKLEFLLGNNWLEVLFTNLLAFSFFFRLTDKLKFLIIATFIATNNTVGPKRTSISQQILYVIQKTQVSNPGNVTILYKWEHKVSPRMKEIVTSYSCKA